jgi:hypothetical protein
MGLMCDLDDGFKEVFFYNVMSIFKDQSKFGLLSTIIQLLVSIQWMDNFVPLLPLWLPFSINYWMCHSVYGFGWLVGLALGYKSWYKEYTPKEYWQIAEQGGEGGKKNV